MGYIVNLVLQGKPVVVVGGGAVGARKIEGLLAGGARITVVASDPCAKIRSLALKGLVAGRWRPYRTSDLDDAFVAVAATDDESLNARIAQDAEARNILVNVVDRPALCTFTVPAIARRGGLTFAVATDGLCPSLAGLLRQEILQRYRPEYGKLVTLFGKLRKEMIALGWGSQRIRKTLSDVYRDGVIALISAENRGRLEDFLRTKLGPDFPLPQ